jgi:hypothetical protein
MTGEAPYVMVDPASVTIPEVEPTVIVPALLPADNVIVPVARPSKVVPKFKSSEVVVANPATAMLPALELVHRFAPGPAPHVPPALPNPSVAPLLSQ